MARRDNRLAARALADWAQHGFTNDAAKRLSDTFKVSVRTLWRWKDALDDDPELSQLFKARLNDYLDRHWADELDATLAEAVTRMRVLIKTSEDLDKVTAAFEKLSEVAITREVLGVTANADEDSASAEARRGHEAPGAYGTN